MDWHKVRNKAMWAFILCVATLAVDVIFATFFDGTHHFFVAGSWMMWLRLVGYFIALTFGF